MMATRALNRSGQPAAPLIHLPTLARPHIVNEDGHELNDEEITALEPASGGENWSTGIVDVLEDTENATESVVEAEGEQDVKEDARDPVLNLAERYVEAMI